MMIFEYLKPAALIGSFVYSLLGVVFVVVAFIVIDKLTPYDLWKELIEERNQPLATVVAALTLAIAIIVASAMH
jgi:putative membrane protein